MASEENYIEINKNLWNQKVPVHLESKFYDVASFLNGKSSLNSIELKLLGDIKGKSILHLQCHFGQDSISLNRLGAKTVGVDFSDKAIDAAKELSEKAGANTDFVCCDIYDLPNHLNDEFDIVYTSYGTIGWLPDLDKWAKIISHYLKPKGKFVFVEFHPLVWMFDDDFQKIKYKYFTSDAIIESKDTTYTKGSLAEEAKEISWNHGLGEVVNSLINNGLKIDSLEEYDYSPYDCFNKTIEFEPGKFRIEQMGDLIPMVYSIVATKV